MASSGGHTAPPIADDATLPPGHPPVGGGSVRGGSGSTLGSGAHVGAPQTASDGGPLPFAWDVPDGWEEHPSPSPMRAREFVVLAEEGAPRLVVYQGIGGGDQANIDRWIGQFLQPDGTESTERAEITTTEEDGVRVTRVEVPGTFTGQMVPGQGPVVEQPDSLFLGGIVDVDGRKFHLKLQGDADQLAEVEAAFDAWLTSLRRAK